MHIILLFYTLDLSITQPLSSAAMPSRKKSMEKKPLVKRLLDGLIPSKAKRRTIVRRLSDDDDGTQSSSGEGVTRSSSGLKRHEEVLQKASASPEPSLLVSGQRPSSSRPDGEEKREGPGETPLVSANSQFFYSPMYRRYFGLTPPNPRLNNPRLLEDYIDWYINVYMEEEIPWQWIDVGNARQRAEQGEQEAREEAQRLASTTSKEKK
ncbi:unnamed protein product [Adineta ricciae]|uniref:Uncharacterized protein n=1 Tax=Adineta ricciae TaxID=249248 RepID=A0A815LZT4_ADIRI|nr:unnamed protein product [Adineta ricciae]CAF1524551.1 unnamed protein product [Adineta ricciae]